MAGEIYQGDNGTVLEITIKDGNQTISLIDASVEVLIKYKDIGIIKQAEIIDAQNGICQITLLSDDVIYEGSYTFQATCTFIDGGIFTSSLQRFTVSKKMGYIPSKGNGGGNKTQVTDSSLNGNIRVDGIEIKVYDDMQIKSDISSLKSSQHAHNNKSTLDKLTDNNTSLLFNGNPIGGSNITTSDKNGNLISDGNEIIVYDDATLMNEITNLKNLDVIKRLGINASGNLTIDGIEITLDDPASPIDGGTFLSTHDTNIIDGGEF